MRSVGTVFEPLLSLLLIVSDSFVGHLRRSFPDAGGGPDASGLLTGEEHYATISLTAE